MDQLDSYLISLIAAHLHPIEASPFRATCRRMRALIAPPTHMPADSLLAGGAFLGDKSICEIARKAGATNWDLMIRKAAKGDHCDLCLLAREWGARDWNRMLRGARLGNSRAICQLAREWGATE